MAVNNKKESAALAAGSFFWFFAVFMEIRVQKDIMAFP
jgi:hypothetical protein